MKSRTVKSFRKAYRQLPDSVRRQAQSAYRLFVSDPYHSSLQFKLIRPEKRIYSVRIGLHYRALGIWDDDDIVWFWIGSHADYDKLIEQL